MSMTRAVRRADPKVAVLRSALGLTGVRERVVVALASHFDEVWVDAGDILMREGEPGRELLLILEGEALVSLADQALATVGPGEFVGEMTLFERAPRSATVTAAGPMRILVAGAQSFGALLADPVVVRRLATTLARRLRAAQGSPPAWRLRSA